MPKVSNRLRFSVGVLSSIVLCKSLGFKKVSDDPWRLVALTRSKYERRRMYGIKALALIKYPDWLSLEIAQACDSCSLVSLSRFGSSIPNFVRSAAVERDFAALQENLQCLLRTLLPECRDECARYHAEVALDRIHVPTSSEEELLWGDPDEMVNAMAFASARPTVKRLLLSLEAVNAFAKIPGSGTVLVEQDVLGILKSIWKKYEESVNVSEIQVKQMCLRVLANIVLIGEEEANCLVSSGWLKILNGCSKRPVENRLDLELLSRKVLGNLDAVLTKSEWKNNPKYEDRIFPVFSSEEDPSTNSPVVDLVFVHGLRGALFRTWRQGDLPVLKNSKKKKKNRQEVGEEIDEVFRWKEKRSQCWPKEWLPKDLSVNCRIVGVDYSSFLTHWGRMCPKEKKLRDLENRGRDLRRKLRSAGVGDRPIIWVCHSMGGLLVKQILSEQAPTESEKSELLNQTIGCVFFSTPHFGTPVASKTLAAKYRYILLPGAEIEQLAEGSPYLTSLNSTFGALTKTHGIRLLSLAETEKQTMKIAGWSFKRYLVPSWSADPGYGDFYRVGDTHLGCCKPESRESVIYRIFLDFIKATLKSASIMD